MVNQNDDNYFEITKNIRIMAAIYDKINTYYVDEPVPGDLMKKGIDEMLRSLDPYTVYIPESDIEDYRFMTTGQYGGIGAMIKTQGEHVIISDPYENFPAHKAGLKAGDKLLKVDGQSVVGKSTQEMSTFLKGGAGTELTITYERAGEVKDVTLTREVIKVPDVPYYGMLDEEVGYIKLNSFTSSASSEVSKALHSLRDSSGMKKLIFDLRGNGGGLLKEAVSIVNFFVPKGELVVYTKGRIQDMNNDYKTRNTPFDTDIPVVVLVDGYSASASEIVSGSLQDLDRAVIVGNTSYGKGLVQQTKDLNFGSKIKLTVAKYYTPSGRCIQKLDYAHRDETGKVHEVADSLLKSFKTKNGRDVMDGRGIEPDIHIDEREFSRLTQVLVVEDHIFNYATEFERKNNSIAKANEFHLSDNQYNDFVLYLQNRDIDYTTYSEELLRELENVAKEEKYYEDSQKEFEALMKELTPSLDADIVRYQDEIIDLLEDEIISRYYYQNGRVEAALHKDDNILESLKILNNQEEYTKILSGKQ